MTKTVSKFLAVLLAIAMIFSFSVVGFAETDTFKLKSGNAAAETGNFKNKYVENLKITAKANVEITLTENFSVKISGTDGKDKEFNASNSTVKVDGKSITISVPFKANMEHDADYTVTISAGSFANADGQTSAEYSYTVNGNLILEKLNVNRPTTTMQKFIKWLSSWKYADIIRPIINLLKWFDSL